MTFLRKIIHKFCSNNNKSKKCFYLKTACQKLYCSDLSNYSVAQDYVARSEPVSGYSLSSVREMKKKMKKIIDSKMERLIQLQGLYAFLFTTFKFILSPFLTKLGIFYIFFFLFYYLLSLTVNQAKDSEQ